MPSGENGNAAKKAGRKTAGRAGRRPLCDLKKEGPGRARAGKKLPLTILKGDAILVQYFWKRSERRFAAKAARRQSNRQLSPRIAAERPEKDETFSRKMGPAVLLFFRAAQASAMGILPRKGGHDTRAIYKR